MINTSNQSSIATVVAKRADGSIQYYVFESDGGVFVGRSANCGLRLQGEGLSEIHCRIELEEGDAWVQDWMSKQGTMVDGDLIETKTLLEPGAVLNIGDYAISIRSDHAAADEPTTVTANEQAVGPEGHGPEAYGPEPHGPEPCGPAESEWEPSAQNLSSERDRTSDTPPLTAEHIPFDFEAEFFEEETFDRETVELLRAEIVDLQAALAERDAQYEVASAGDIEISETSPETDQTDALLSRMQELLDEAARSDERVALLEEMLQASEDASRNELEERNQLESWVGEIERRIGQREDEHAAEIESLKQRVDETIAQRDQLQRKLHHAASHGPAPKQYEETLETLQRQNRELQARLDESEKQHATLVKRLETSQLDRDEALREERATIAQERAKISRLRFELSNRLTGLEELPKTENEADRETALRLQTLRQHLREIHEEEKQEAKQASLATRVKKLWNRVEY